MKQYVIVLTEVEIINLFDLLNIELNFNKKTITKERKKILESIVEAIRNKQQTLDL